MSPVPLHWDSWALCTVGRRPGCLGLRSWLALGWWGLGPALPVHSGQKSGPACQCTCPPSLPMPHSLPCLQLCCTLLSGQLCLLLLSSCHFSAFPGCPCPDSLYHFHSLCLLLSLSLSTAVGLSASLALPYCISLLVFPYFFLFLGFFLFICGSLSITSSEGLFLVLCLCLSLSVGLCTSLSLPESVFPS